MSKRILTNKKVVMFDNVEYKMASSVVCVRLNRVQVTQWLRLFSNVVGPQQHNAVRRSHSTPTTC